LRLPPGEIGAVILNDRRHPSRIDKAACTARGWRIPADRGPVHASRAATL
jgi:hypothetical protein